MKRITRLLFAALFAFGLNPPADAQDAAAPFRRSPAPEEDTPAPEPAATPEEEPPRRAEPAATPPPAATPAPAERPAPDAEKREEAAPQPSPAERAATPSRKALQVAPVRAVEPRPASARRPRPTEREDQRDRPSDDDARPPSPPQPERRSAASLDYWDEDPGSAVKSLERKWQKAIVEKDVDTIRDLLANDFVATSSTGRVGSKSTLLAAIRRDRNEYKSADARGMSVRMLGPRVAVVTGVAIESGTTPNGKAFRNSRRFTDTWMLRSGRWKCVASQATEVPDR